MPRYQFTPALLAFTCTIALVLTACNATNDDLYDEASFRTSDGQAQTLSGDSAGGLWINNGLDDPEVSGIDPAYPLSSPEGLSEGGELLQDPDGRDTVQYLVECALAEEQSITKEVDGESLVFEGAIGLAPEWEDEACDEDCQEWVSACMLARTNVSGETISIWMRADHPAIGEGLSLLYPVYEASFFGNLFVEDGGRHYCEGTLLAGPLVSQLEGRTCAGLSAASCGFVKYTQCEAQHRCAYPLLGALGLGLQASARDCIAGLISTGPSFHTISTHVSAL
jgi:hypothetical protein